MALGQAEQLVVRSFFHTVMEQGGQFGLGYVDAVALGQGQGHFPHAQHMLEPGGRQVFIQVRLDAGDLVGVVYHGGKPVSA